MDHLLSEPVGIFLIVISVILLAPMLSRLIHLPDIIGLIVGGVVIGPHGLGLLEREGAVELLATVGLIYLMFSAGAEIDLTQFKRVRNRSLFFGGLTFIIPQIIGTGIGFALGFELLSSILLGSIFASHTLISFPIIIRLGITHNEPVAVTVGATIITDIAALLVLAAIAGSADGNTNVIFFVRLIGFLFIYTLIILFAVPYVGRLFFKYFRASSVEFQFVLVVIFIAAFTAELIGMEAIVGAFLAGLAINSTVPDRSAVMGRVLFIGEAFFIPVFLISIGLLIDPMAFFTDQRTVIVSVVLVATVLITKYLASWMTALRFGYSRDEVFVMWGLSMAQAAATLAAALIGIEIGLLEPAVFNGVVTMILVTCVLSPILIERYGARLTIIEETAQEDNSTSEPLAPLYSRILIPVSNPKTETFLIELASILSTKSDGLLMPLNVARLIDGQIKGLAQQAQLLDIKFPVDNETRIQPIWRIDASVSNGILCTAIEYDASAIIMGWSGESSFYKTAFGRMLDEVIWNASVPVLVGRLTSSIVSKQRILLVIPTNSLRGHLLQDAIDAALLIAQAVDIPLKILIAGQYQGDLVRLDENSSLELDIEHLESDVVGYLTELAQPSDLLILATFGSQRRFQSSLGKLPEEIAERTTASLIVIRFPASSI